MSNRFKYLFALVLIGAGLGVAAGFVYNLRNDTETTDIVRGIFTVRTVDAAAGPKRSQNEIAQLARAGLVPHLAKSLNGLARIAGRPLTIDDLTREVEFAPAATDVFANDGSSYHYTRGDGPASLWVLSYKATGVTLPDLGRNDGEVEANVIINDETGEIEAMDVLRSGPG